MDFDQNWLADKLMILIPLILSLSVHECAHAWAAWKLGDDTARLLGRMTINPLVHIDPLGTVILPLLGVPFGWAKPVPVNPLRFTHRVSMRTGMMLTAIAGPLSNLAIALGCTLLVVVAIRINPAAVRPAAPLGHLLRLLICMNVMLAVFNMLPIPPLDGSRVVDALMPHALRPAWEQICQIGPFALLAVLLLPRLAEVSILAGPVNFVMSLLGWLVETLT
jgi:Zn-dependent protease